MISNAKKTDQGKEKDTSVFCCDIGGVGKAGAANAGCVSLPTTHIVSLSNAHPADEYIFRVLPLIEGKFKYTPRSS